MTCNCTTDGNNCGCQTNIAEENSIEYYYNQTDSNKNKIDIYDNPVLYSDTDARLLYVLGNPNKINFTDNIDGYEIKKGRTFNIPINGDVNNLASFKILEVSRLGIFAQQNKYCVNIKI